MNCLSRLSSCATSLLLRSLPHSSLTATTSLSNTTTFRYRPIELVNLKITELGFLSSRFRVHCFASKRGKKAAPVSEPKEPGVMEQEKDAFFVVRKGDLIGVYKNFSDCQAQVGSSICDPPVSVYKGYSLGKETVDHLLSHGLQNALYTIRAADLKEDLFGTLVPCPFQQPNSSEGETSMKDVTKKRPHEVIEAGGMPSVSNVSSKQLKLDSKAQSQVGSCVLEFDGASKGNPGQAGAGAVLRADDGTLICRLREGIGKATNNVAEYRAVILGLKYALQKGYNRIHVHGDSKLVCMQIQGLWKVKNENITNLYEEAKKLKNKFLSFEISHVLREFNSDADAQANLAINLADGQVQEVFE